ncbi:hypothetical protein BH24DEI2_BH24DEI2_15130 [soil metagenome]
MAARSLDAPAPERIPFYRNVKVIGTLAQIIFAAIVLVAVVVMVRNVTVALQRSNLPADFSFLDNRAGVPIAETPIPYSAATSSYLRAFIIGVLNTLKVALVGVVLASLLGTLIGVMRLSNNWILRQLATGYVELIRNTPLAVQIVFWFTAVLTPLPPRSSNPISLPFGGYLSNLGLALPWLYPSHRFSAWWPWLLGALVAAVVVYGLRRRSVERSERPGSPWPLTLLTLFGIAAVGYAVSLSTPGLPTNTATRFNPGTGVATVYRDANGNGTFERDEQKLPFTSVTVTIPTAVLTTQTQNLTESRRFVYSTFRFPTIKESEFGAAEVTFINPDATEGLAIAFDKFPSEGVVYRDADGNGEFDRGEEIQTQDGNSAGYSAQVQLTLTDFERRVVTDRDGEMRIPRFTASAPGAAAETTRNVSPGQLFGTPGGAQRGSELEVNLSINESGPLVLSRPSIPISDYFGGISLSVSYLAMLLALVIYTASFIAEIVRAGIQAVAKGQTEASKALGLSGYQTFSLIVFPQALRIILPPMISQYLNLTKNSSLGLIAAYVEIFAISAIIANQTGASVPMTLMVIASYLLISFAFAFVLNIVNARMALVER